MGKNLKDIPAQKKMSEEQEQTFTNGINKGRKLGRDESNKILFGLFDLINAKLVWECGDCGNIYDHSISTCTNEFLDEMMVLMRKAKQ